MKSQIFFLFLFFSFQADRALATETYRYEDMRRFLIQMRQDPELPRALPESCDYDLSKSVDPTIEKIFVNIQKFVYGRDNLLRIVPHDLVRSAVQLKPACKMVVVDPFLSEQIFKTYDEPSSEVIANFLIAHEISHLVQDESVQLNGQSANGFRKVHMKLTAKDAILAHAETDAYALIILHDMKSVRPDVVLKYLESVLTEAKTNPDADSYPISDATFRLQQAPKVIADLWTDDEQVVLKSPTEIK